MKATLSDQSVVAETIEDFMNQFQHASPHSSVHLLSLVAHSQRLQKLLLSKQAKPNDQLFEVQNALKLVEQLYKVFKDVDTYMHKDFVSKVCLSAQ